MKTKPVWTLAIALMAVTGCQSYAQSNSVAAVQAPTSHLFSSSTSAVNKLNTQQQAPYSTFPQTHSTATPKLPTATQTLPAATTHISYDASENALQFAKRNPNLSILVEAVDAAGVSGLLRFAGKNYTIFAPDNAAFEAWFNGTTMTKQKLMQNKPLLRILLAYHVVKTQHPLTMAQMQPSKLTTFNKYQLTITNQKTIRDGIGRTAVIKAADIPTGNGTVHIIDKVLFPEG